MNASRNVARSRQGQPEEVGLDELDPVAACRSRPRRARSRARCEHRRIEVDGGDPVTRPPRAGRDPAGACTELEDRAARPRRERQVQVEVARILDEVEVVEAGQGCADGARFVGHESVAVPSRPVRSARSPRRAA